MERNYGASRAAQRRLADTRVAVVEDEILIALDVEEALVGEGARVARAATLDTGFAAVAEGCDCAVLDERLGDTLVFPLADRLTSEGVPLVFYTGLPDRVAIAERYPGSIFLSKPARSEEVVTAVSQATAQARKRVPAPD